MKTIFKVMVAIPLATLIHGDKFCVPKQWNGLQYGGGNLFRPTSFEAERAYYDANNKKYALSGAFVTDQMKTEVKFIDDYNIEKSYLIKPSTQECTISDIGYNFPEFCVPDNAKELEPDYVGVGEKNLSVIGYTFPYNDGFYDIKVLMVVTTPGYFPISLDVRGKYNNTDYFEVFNFLDISPGIPDDTIFDPPDYCNELTTIMEQTDDKVLRWHSSFKL